MTTKAGVGGLGRWGRFVAHHRWWVLALWLVALVAVVSVGKGRQHDTNDDFAIPGTDAQRAVAVLQERFPSQNNATANVVFHAPTGTLSTPAAQQAIAATTTALKGVPGVGGVGSLVSAPDGATAYLTVTFDQPASAFTPSDRAPYDALVAAAAPARPAGVEVAFGGNLVDVYSTGSNWISEHADVIGIGIAIVLLLLAFGSVVGMLLPIATALLGVAVASNAVLLLTFVTDVSSIAPVLAVMLGLGVGIDYSLFVILFGLSMDYEVFLMSRIHEEFVATGDPRAATVRGLGLTARVITTAALIMMAVFLAYVSTPNPTIKLLGFGMAVAVLLDSTVVRCVLVPSIMELLGRAAWWLPSWLRWLPRINVEGAPPVSAAPARPATERGQGDERDERESVGATNG